MALKKWLCLVLLVGLFLAAGGQPARADPATYYVSSLGGDDDNPGTELAPFKTIGKVNGLALGPGDRVLFKCGDTWRAEQLVIGKSGAAGNPITFGSYPAGCANKPILSGAQLISGWTTSGTPNVYVTNLNAGANAGKFAYGVNQLFRGDERLPMGRWPNLDQPDGGYSTIDGQPSGDRITDNQLPAVDWTGAMAHIRGMRWYILNRQVTGRSGQTLSLNAAAGCWGNCTGWGYFLNNHLATLDREGEWYYNAATKQLYLYTTGGMPANGAIEGSVILKDDDRSWGGVMLGVDLNECGISYVVVENLDVRRWFRHGIATPTNHAHSENHHLTLRNNIITDVDSTGINLAAWVWGADDGRPDGWRGGYNLTVDGNVIDAANRMGVNTYSRNSTFSNNVIRNVGLIQNLGAAGLGCGIGDDEGQCTEDGDGLRIKIDQANDSGCYNTLTGNRLERIGYGGIQIFGHHNTFEHNVILDACYTKGDCGAVGTYASSFSGTSVHDLTFRENILVNTIGNTDGCESTYDDLFGFGFYLTNSQNMTLVGNTVISSSVHGILFQSSTGSVTGNTLYGNGYAREYDGAQVYVEASPSSVSAHTGNVLCGLQPHVRTLWLDDPSRLGSSDNNYFFNPYRAANIHAGSDRTLAQWRTYSGKDANSKAAWFSQSAGEPPRSRILYNDTAQTTVIPLGASLYLDLDQNEVRGGLTLLPYTSRVLVYNGENLIPDLSPSTKAVWPALARTGDAVTYTVVIRNYGAPVTTTVRLTDTLPAGLSYVPGTLTATLGVVDASAAPALRWSDILSRTPAVTITFAAIVEATEAQTIVNTAQIDGGLGVVLPRSATLLANAHQVYLPLALKNSP